MIVVMFYHIRGLDIMESQPPNGARFGSKKAEERKIGEEVMSLHGGIPKQTTGLLKHWHFDLMLAKDWYKIQLAGSSLQLLRMSKAAQEDCFSEEQDAF
jgi:hypothetical protein